MNGIVRSLIPVVAISVVLMLLLDLWIRWQPLSMTRATQIGLTLALVAVSAGVLALVRRVERAEPPP